MPYNLAGRSSSCHLCLSCFWPKVFGGASYINHSLFNPHAHVDDTFLDFYSLQLENLYDDTDRCGNGSLNLIIAHVSTETLVL